MDVAVWKPLLVTYGGERDRSVRLWNYVARTCQVDQSVVRVATPVGRPIFGVLRLPACRLATKRGCVFGTSVPRRSASAGYTLQCVKHFSDEICSVAMHPSGLHVLLGFGDKLRMCAMRHILPGLAIHSISARHIVPGLVAGTTCCSTTCSRSSSLQSSSAASMQPAHSLTAECSRGVAVARGGGECSECACQMARKSCRLPVVCRCRFSHGGHVFAAVSTFSILLFATYSAEKLAVLSAHQVTLNRPTGGAARSSSAASHRDRDWNGM